MARCDCSSTAQCQCLVTGGENIDVTGGGTLTDPYVINTAGVDISDSVTFIDSPTVDFSTTGAGTTEDPWQVQATATVRVQDLTDVTCASPSAGQTLVWDGSGWACGVPEIALDDLSDVTADAPADNDVLTWDGTAWVPAAVSAEPGTVVVGGSISGDGTTASPFEINVTHDDTLTGAGTGASPLSVSEQAVDEMIAPRFVEYYRLAQKANGVNIGSDNWYALSGGMVSLVVAENFPGFDGETGEFTIPADGIWDVRGSFRFPWPSPGPSEGLRQARVMVDGVQIMVSNVEAVSMNSTTSVTIAGLAALNAGQNLIFEARHSQGTNLTGDADPSGNWVNLRRVAPLPSSASDFDLPLGDDNPDDPGSTPLP